MVPVKRILKAIRKKKIIKAVRKGKALRIAEILLKNKVGVLAAAAAATAKSFSRVRLCDPIDGSPPGSPVPGILQARTLERVAISFSNV